MGALVLSLILAGGAALFVYAKVGRRIGYTNPKNLWTVVGATFAIAFIAILIVAKTLGF